jgi:hypothetical protein
MDEETKAAKLAEIDACERRILARHDQMVKALKDGGVELDFDNSDEVRAEAIRLCNAMREKIQAGQEIEPSDKEWTVTYEGSAAHFKDGRRSGKTKQTPAEAIATVANMLGQVLADLPEDTVAAARVRMAIRLLSELRVSG